MWDLIPLIWIGDTTPWRGMTVWITFLQFRVLFGQDRSFIDSIRHIMNRTQVYRIRKPQLPGSRLKNADSDWQVDANESN
jgi:hypothetical protein